MNDDSTSIEQIKKIIEQHLGKLEKLAKQGEELFKKNQEEQYNDSQKQLGKLKKQLKTLYPEFKQTQTEVIAQITNHRKIMEPEDVKRYLKKYSEIINGMKDRGFFGDEKTGYI